MLSWKGHRAMVGLILSLLLPVAAEIREFRILLPPEEEFIHFTNGYLRGPGYIDITDLTFTAISETFAIPEDEIPETTEVDDAIDVVSDDQTRRRLDGGVEMEAFVLDVAIFPLPASCASSRKGCDWTELGVGAKNDEGTLRWCCSRDAMDLGMCEEDQLGRLILAEAFAGSHRFINVPFTGPMKKQLKYGKFEEAESGQFVVVFSNCNPDGREVEVTGHSVWKSKHGFLPGELYGFMFFYFSLLIFYALLMGAYAFAMQRNKESRIPIEKWILMTIVMGFSEMFFRSSDYLRWNQNGYRPMLFVYAGIIMGVLKRGISRVLVVMVSLGWGVVRDSLGGTMRSIIITGALYIAVSIARDLMIVFAVEDFQTLSYEQEVEIFDVLTVLTFIVAAIDVVFILWILDALNGTMQYLENMNQTRKLKRYLTLRSIFLYSILFATIWVVFSLVDNYDEDGIVREEHEWAVEAATEINYLFVLVGVAILWRPNPSARDYAYVMELPATGGDGDDGEFELSGDVPSAADDEDEPTGIMKDHDERFKIDDAEPS